MKRSEMIESIVYNCLSWDGLDTCGVPAEEIANDILTHLENMGMLPPSIKNPKPVGSWNISIESVMVNQWEPEDNETR